MRSREIEPLIVPRAAGSARRAGLPAGITVDREGGGRKTASPSRVSRYTGGMPDSQTSCELAAKKCLPCEGGVSRYTPEEAEVQVRALPHWRLTHDGQRIRRDLAFPDFRAAVKFVNNVAALAEREQHHPDLHIEGYRKAWVEIHTHAIGGLSENDFILAAKIDGIAPSA